MQQKRLENLYSFPFENKEKKKTILHEFDYLKMRLVLLLFVSFGWMHPY